MHMRKFGYLAVVLALLAISLGVYFYRPSSTPAPDGEAVGEPALRPAGAVPAQSGEGTITVEGENLSPWEKQALGEAFRKIISDAIHEAVNKGVEDLYRELRITDELEKSLLAAANCWPDQGPDPDGPLVLSVLLIRPGSADQPPETIEVSGNQPMTLRFTRVLASVERPVAVATLTWMRAGRLEQRERFLVYGADEEWRAAQSAPVRGRAGEK